MKRLIPFTLVCFAFIGLSFGSSTYKLVLYEERDCVGLYVTAPSDSYGVDDLDKLVGAVGGLRPRSVSFNGTWVFYDQKKFVSEGPVETIYRYTDSCVNLNHDVASFRSVGQSSYNDGTITLYTAADYQAEYPEKIEYDSHSLMRHKFESFIITGRSAWTLYSDFDYDGDANCIKPQDTGYFAPTFVRNSTETYPEIKYIRSVKKGCHAS